MCFLDFWKSYGTLGQNTLIFRFLEKLWNPGPKHSYFQIFGKVMEPWAKTLLFSDFWKSYGTLGQNTLTISITFTRVGKIILQLSIPRGKHSLANGLTQGLVYTFDDGKRYLHSSGTDHYHRNVNSEPY